MKSTINPNYFNAKFVSYLLFIFAFYYVVNFLIFDLNRLEDGTYIYVVISNMSLCILFSAASKHIQESVSFQDTPEEPINEIRAYYASILFLCAWVIYYEEFILKIHFSKLSGLALLCTYSSFSYFISNGKSEDSLDNGKEFYEKNIIHSFVHALIWLTVGIGSLSLMFLGEWVSPLR